LRRKARFGLNGHVKGLAMNVFRHRHRTAIALACAAVVWAAHGGTATAPGDEGAFRTISPIFGQLVVVNLPKGFLPASEKVKDDFYIREAVPRGENLQAWRQMITVTGAKGLATKMVTPRAYLDHMAIGYQKACTLSFSGEAISEGKLGAFDAAIAVLSCGTSPGSAGKTSETTLIVAIKGAADIYTVQWSEWSAPSPTPLRINLDLWRDRLGQLSPIQLCPIVAGEAPPYPSCIGRAGR
jgi:hypothetical protein